MKRKAHLKEKKTLSMPGLLKIVRKSFQQIPYSHSNTKMALCDILMSAVAMFSLKSPSLLAFDNGVAEKPVLHNLHTLYGIKKVPCDTYMREVLDEVDPRELRTGFLKLFDEIRKGKLLESYRFLGGYLCLIDGTQIFHSEKVHCKNCCEKKHRDGRLSYYHQMVGAVIAKPGLHEVIPLCPEMITKQDGATKNDCERNSFDRFIQDLHKEHPRLKATIVSDALSANAVHVNKLKSLGYSFIINVKPKGNRTLFEWVKGSTTSIKLTKGKGHYSFRYVNGVPLNNTKEAPEVNFLECESVEIKGKKKVKKYFSWVTDHKITPENIYTIMQGGRTRWMIENETFNTLKNQGYQLEHNFGHGKKNLHTVFALLMMLTFLIDQVQEASCGLFQKAMQSRKTRRAFWERMRSFFHIYLILSWKDLFHALDPDFEAGVLQPDTS